MSGAGGMRPMPTRSAIWDEPPETPRDQYRGDSSPGARAMTADVAHDYCARPRCRALFVPDDGRGRRQRYCSAECRRAAETERKRVIARIASLERSLRLARLDLAVFGLEPDATDDDTEETPG